MTEERLVLADLLEKAGDGDFLRAVAEAVLQLLMESDVEGMIGAGRYERSGERTTWRSRRIHWMSDYARSASPISDRQPFRGKRRLSTGSSDIW
jgi:transposase-like protein